MTFNHYAKIKQVLEQEPSGWYIKRIDQPTSARKFNGETRYFDHYYRIYSANDEPIKYCKFQQIDLLAKVLKIDVSELPIK
ncbi:hypothetical protein KC939_02765 [Candidatus Saccharibacteria bacterium]|nr:hypothetical protein [Candidatus Saccharibacteria bacterium]